MATAKFGGQVARQGLCIASGHNYLYTFFCPIVTKTVLEVLDFLNLVNKDVVCLFGIDSGVYIVIQIRVGLNFPPRFLLLVYEDYIILWIGRELFF